MCSRCLFFEIAPFSRRFCLFVRVRRAFSTSCWLEGVDVDKFEDGIREEQDVWEDSVPAGGAPLVCASGCERKGYIEPG